MDDYARQTASAFAGTRVAGIVLKSRSPSCGMGDAKLHDNGAVVSEDGTGIFASSLAAALPEAPQISEVDLESPARRDHWLTRVFALAEIRELFADPPEARKLYEFHARWKMVLMAHSERTARRLGRSLAAARDVPSALPRYREEFLAGLAEPASVGTHHNVLLHLAGHLRKPLEPAARARLGNEIAAFLARRFPWRRRSVPSPPGRQDWGFRVSGTRHTSPSARSLSPTAKGSTASDGSPLGHRPGRFSPWAPAITRR